MGTMTVSSTPKGFVSESGGMKMGVFVFTGSASYATGGDTMPALGTAALGAGLGFTTVHSIVIVAQPTAANDKYLCTFIPGASDSATAGLIKIRDLSAASDAEVTSTTDLSAVTFRALVMGT